MICLDKQTDRRDIMEKKYRAADFGRLILHWFLTLLGIAVVFWLQYSFMEPTYSDTDNFFPIDIYTVNKPLFIFGAVIIAVGYIFVWRLWLKKDLIRCAEVHWEWLALYIVVALWNLVLVFMLGLAAQLLHIPGLFSSVEDIAEIFPLFVVGYMILLPVAESIITGLKRRNEKEQL